MNRDFWKGRRVFLTGHTGFKGSWASLWLQDLGAEVRGFALPPPTEPGLFVEADVAAGMDSQIGDIRDYEVLQESLSAFRPEVVLHLAAQPLVRLSYEIPVQTYATNVMGTVHLLEAIRKTGGVKAIVNITSDKCYENHGKLQGYREDEPMGGFDPYSNSKGCAELVTASFRQSFFNNARYREHGCALASARAGNVIGGGDWASDRLVPDILRTFERRQAVKIRNPHAIRPWQHVLEPLAGYLELAERLYLDGPEFAEAWNFGPDESDEKPVEWIVERLVEDWGEGAGWLHDNTPQPHEASYLKLDSTKARTRLGWRPHWGLGETLGRIVRWHKSWLNGEDMRQVSLDEIHDHMNTGAV